MRANKEIFPYFLITLAVSSYILGYIFDENAAGGGHLKGDITLIWPNLQLFLNNDFSSAVVDPYYKSSRFPGVYLFHKFLNPFVDTVENYRRSVFGISFLLPILFFFCLKKRFKNTEHITLLIIASTIFFSPYFRTSAFWGLEENISLIFVMLTYLSLNYFLTDTNLNGLNKIFFLFLITFLSSLTFYFDSKLIIIPLICYIQIMLSNENVRIKILMTAMYVILSLPCLYLITLWGNIVPPAAQITRKVGNIFLPENIGYMSTIIAFYLVPITFFKKDILNDLKSFLFNKLNIFLIILFILYLGYLINFFNFENQEILGKGIVHKLSLVVFDDNLYRKIFTFFAFIISWFFVLFFLNNNLINRVVLIYFILFSFISYPVLQEYFDPLIVLMIFTYFKGSITINRSGSYFLFFYLFLLLVGSDIYYYNFFN